MRMVVTSITVNVISIISIVVVAVIASGDINDDSSENQSAKLTTDQAT